MTEQELRFILSAQDEGLRRGIEAAEKAVEGLDKAVLQLTGTQLKYNTAAGLFIDSAGKFVSNQTALQQAGIVTSNQLRDQIRLYDELIVRFKQDEVVTRQLIQQKELLQRQYGLLDTAQVQVGRSTRANTQLYFQAGQAISDFAVAGIRGAANNIEFLAAALGASAPLLIGISLASAAFFTFGDDITRILTPIRSQAKETEQALSDLLNVVGTTKPDLSILESQLPAAIDENKRKIRELEKEVRGSTYFMTILQAAGALSPVIGDVPVGLFDGLLGTKEETERLGRLKGELADFQSRLDEVNSRNETAASLSENSIIRNNALKAETIRLDLELAGLAEEAAGYTNQQLLELESQIEYQGILNKLQKDATTSKKDQLTEAQRLTQENASLSAVLSSINRGEIDRTEELRIQNRELNQQVEQARRILALRLQTGGSLTAGLALEGLQRAQTSDIQITPGLDTRALLEQLGGRLPGGEVLAEGAGLAAENMARMREEAAALIGLNQQLTQSIQSGLTNAFTDLAGAIGEAATSGEGFQNFGAKILQSLGGFAQQFGATLIAFGTAGLAVQSFVANPIGALIAGGALVALGGALKGAAKQQQEKFNASQSAGTVVRPAVTALGFNTTPDPIGRGAINPIGTRTSRPAVELSVRPYETITPSGDVIRGIRSALVTEAKKGGPGKL